MAGEYGRDTLTPMLGIIAFFVGLGLLLEGRYGRPNRDDRRVYLPGDPAATGKNLKAAIKAWEAGERDAISCAIEKLQEECVAARAWPSRPDSQLPSAPKKPRRLVSDHQMRKPHSK